MWWAVLVSNCRAALNVVNLFGVRAPRSRLLVSCVAVSPVRDSSQREPHTRRCKSVEVCRIERAVDVHSTRSAPRHRPRFAPAQAPVCRAHVGNLRRWSQRREHRARLASWRYSSPPSTPPQQHEQHFPLYHPQLPGHRLDSVLVTWFHERLNLLAHPRRQQRELAGWHAGLVRRAEPDPASLWTANATCIRAMSSTSRPAATPSMTTHTPPTTSYGKQPWRTNS